MKADKLIRMAQDGDRGALDRLIRTYYDVIFAYCYHHVEDRQAAEDLCQDTFLSVLENLDNYRHVGKFLNYLYVVAGNKCKNYYKKHRELPVEDMENLEPFLEETPGGGRRNMQTSFPAEEAIGVRDLVKRLPEEFREAVILRFYQELDYRSIARITGCSVSTAKYRVKRGLAFLKNEWAKSDG